MTNNGDSNRRSAAIASPAAVPASAALDDPRVHQAMEEYLQLLETERRPDRQAFLARYPDLAEALAGCLQGLDFVHAAGAELSHPAAGVPADAVEPAEALGDFRIVREVGRGGMAVVYEAVQVSLGRRVALKVLPFAATMDPRQLQRFHNESRAAASLDHPHIVHVHAVGCERAVHFYAMQFIEGQTLAALIADLRQRGGKLALPEPQPTTPHVPGQPEPSAETAPLAAASTERTQRTPAHFRRMAELGIQAAEALDHAHTLGIVHRDVKPANLLVDSRGSLWVADFGLAHIQSDARMTMTGDLVGTLRYMSLEQALAKRVVMDHRTDVYSLGATLYELLTLEQAYRGNDRQELLRQIAFEEPRPPRRINKAIPAELETIVLKAMEKNPAERYATAKELADDLRRFLADEPIWARPAGILRRLRKWGQRHPAVMAAAAAALTVAVVVLSGGIGWVANDRSIRAQRTEDEIRIALQESAEWQQRRRVPEALAAARRAKGALAGGHADFAVQHQVEARVDDLELLARLEEARLEGVELKDYKFDLALVDRRLGEVCREFHLDVDAWSAEEAGKRLRASSVSLEWAALLDDWAMLRQRLNPQEEAKWKHLLDIARAADADGWRTQLRKALAAKDPKALLNLASSDEAMLQHSWTLHALGDRLLRIGAVHPAEALLRKAQRQFPDDFWINQNLGSLLRRARPSRNEEAIPLFLVAVALRPQSVGAHLSLGAVLSEKKDLDGAIAEYHKAIDIDPRVAMSHSNLGIVLHAKQDLDGAIAEHKKAIALDPKYAGAHSSLGNALLDKKDLDGAVTAYRKAIALDSGYAPAHYNLGNALRAKQDVEGAIAEYRKAIALDSEHALAHNNLGLALVDKGDLDGAIAEFHKAIKIDPKLAQAHNNLGNAFYEKRHLDRAIVEFRKAIDIDPNLAGAYNGLGNALADKQDVVGAIAALRKAIKIDPNLAQAHNNLANALADKGDLNGAIVEFQKAIDIDPGYVKAHYNLGTILQDKKNLDGAIDAYRKAIRLKPDFAEAHGGLGSALRDKGQFADALIHYRRSHELGSKNPRWSNPSAQWVKECERLVELDGKLPAVLSGKEQPADATERIEYAVVCQIKRLYTAATRLYQEAISAQPGLVASPVNGIRYNAACAAALAGCGAGKDAAKLTGAERAGLRKQALDWLRADLDAWRGQLDKGPDKALPVVAQKMQHWLRDSDFNGVRGSEALAKLPEGERLAWHQLWQEVEALRQSAAGAK